MLVCKFCSIEPECAVYPTFNYPGEKKGLYCAKHKKEGMINITGKICIVPGCNIFKFQFSWRDREIILC